MDNPTTSPRTSHLRGLVSSWGNRWGLRGLEKRIRIEFSPRLRTSLGRCLPARGIIRLHPTLGTAESNLLDEVLAHEVAHVAVFLRHGTGPRPHGSEWAAFVRLAGYEPRTRLPHSEVLSRGGELPRRRFLYDHRCPVCQTMRIARRPVTRWRCRACVEAGLDGRMEITRRTIA